MYKKAWICWLSGALVFLCLHTPAQAKQRAAIFVISPSGPPAGQQTSAVLAWLARRMVKEPLKAKGMELMDRGLFFSRSHALSAARWRKRALRVANDGFQAYTSDPSNAFSQLLRASRFLEFAYKYDFDVPNMQRSLYFTGVLQFRKGNKKQGISTVKRAILLNFQNKPPSEFDGEEKKFVQAVKCRTTAEKKGTLTIRTGGADSVIYINNKSAGIGQNLSFQLPPGEYFITVQRDGYRHWGRKVRVRAGKKRRITARNRRSPRFYAFQKFCKTLSGSSEAEQLTDELKKILHLFRRQSVKYTMIGCFRPSGKGTSGTLSWFGISKDAGKGLRGSVNIPTGTAARARAIAQPLRKIGFPLKVETPTLRQYTVPGSKGGCADPAKIALRPLGQAKQPERPVWTESPGDYIVIYTKYGFRLQGKVLGIEGPVLTLQVAKGRRDPNELKGIKVNRGMVKWSWILGPKQEGGFRIGERLIVQTVYGVSVTGNLMADDGDRIRLRTRQGTESIPWSMIRRLLRRDQ